ncbi:hypothetical protein [Nocardioides solisilvae]|uniref:hypothetical protein n=1 Tax=Nocardioides solisilvae TaxID=1542435 RepID=UPI000D74B716|nr:hypothetical protein [Nocardioides solisilvae]
MRRRLAPLVLAGLAPLILSACGGGGEGESDEAKPYVDAMATSMAEGDSPMDKEQSTCFSEGFVDVVGLDKVKEAGSPEEFGEGTDDLDFSTLELTEDQGNDIYDNFEECGVDLRDEMLKEMSADDSIPAESKECVEDAITEDALRDFFVTSMVEGEEAGGAGGELMGALMGCMMPEGTESPSAE